MKKYFIKCNKYRKFQNPIMYFIMYIHVLLINVIEENICQELRLKKIDGIRNHFIKEIKQKDLMSNKHKNISVNLNYMEHLIILLSTITGCDSISSFASLFGILIGITSSIVGLKNLCNNCRN